MKQALNMSQ